MAYVCIRLYREFFFSRYALPKLSLLSYKNNFYLKIVIVYEQAYRKIKKTAY
jgi:hypothetical protein